jgi:hypothetical protein
MSALVIFYAFTLFTISCRGQSISLELAARTHLDHTGSQAELEHLHQKRSIQKRLIECKHAVAIIFASSHFVIYGFPGRNAWLNHFRRQLSDNATIPGVDSLMNGVGAANGSTTAPTTLTASKDDHRYVMDFWALTIADMANPSDLCHNNQDDRTRCEDWRAESQA